MLRVESVRELLQRQLTRRAPHMDALNVEETSSGMVISVAAKKPSLIELSRQNGWREDNIIVSHFVCSWSLLASLF